MRRGATRFACCVLLAAVAAGCHTTHSPPAPKGPPPDLPVVPRSAVEPDVSGLPVDAAGTVPTRPDRYRRLTAAAARALAVKNAPFADDLDRHPENTPAKHPRLHPLKPDCDEAQCGRLVRGYAADELRNRAAAEALDQFFQLAQSEGQFDLLTRAHAELRTQVTAAEEAVRQGFRPPADVDALRGQLSETEAQLARLEGGIGALNASLRARLGLDPADPLPLWPDDPLRVRPDEVDTDEAVRTGLHYRPDLNLLRALLGCGGASSGDLTQSVLTGVNPLLAEARPSPLLALLGPIAEKKLAGAAEGARQRVAGVLEARERQAEAEIRAAVATLRGHRLVAAARAAEVRRLMDRVADLEKRQAAGQQVTAELVKARLDLLKARGELLQAAADWNRAEVRLRQAMGLLVRE